MKSFQYNEDFSYNRHYQSIIQREIVSGVTFTVFG